MGNCVSTFKRKKEPVKNITLAIIGLDNAGKTTLCSVLSGDQPDPDIAPTVGFRSIKFSHSNFNVTLFDLGGGKNIRPIWKTYFGEVYGVIYVLDSSSPSRMKEARNAFKETLGHPQIAGKPVLLMSNKVDKEDHMDKDTIVRDLQFEETVIAKGCPSKMVMVSALKGTGNKMDPEIQGGLKWLFEKIRFSLSTLEPRVAEDMKTAKEARDKEREERRARVKKQKEEREKAEELERTRLGLEKKEDSDDEDIVDGNPFQALDLEKLKKKEQRLKEEKLQKQERMKELGYGDLTKKSRDDAMPYALDDSYRPLRSGHRMDLKRFDLSGDETLRLDDVDPSAGLGGLFGRNTRGSTLPPLEPLGSKSLDLTTSGGEKKNRKKKKKLTDYHLSSHHEVDHKEDAIGRLGLSLHEPGYRRNEPDIHDLTPRVAKPKKTRLVMAGKIDEDEEEDDPYKEIGAPHNCRYNDMNGSHDTQKRFTKSKLEDRDSSHMNGYNKNHSKRETAESKYQKFMRELSPPNLNSFDEEDKDEGIGREDSDYNFSDVDRDDVRAYRSTQGENISRSQAHRGGKKNKPLRRHLDSDEENESYAVHNAMKDTLRFPPDSPDEDEPNRDFQKEINELRRRQRGGYDDRRNQEIMENGYGKYHGRWEEDEVRGARKGRIARDIADDDKDSERSDHRRKKKRNLLKSNKLAPSDDDELSVEDRFASPRMVQEHGSRGTSDADLTPTKNRNSQLTRMRHMDSDFSLQWGLAEDLPTVDNNAKVRRLPNYDDRDGRDVIF